MHAVFIITKEKLLNELNSIYIRIYEGILQVKRLKNVSFRVKS